MKLPDKPSELIRLAIGDLVKCEADKGYAIVMSDWHNYSSSRDTCYVCLAGAVMAQTLGVPRRQYRGPCSATEGESDMLKLIALDRFRMGLVLDGLKELRIVRDIEPYRHIVQYREDPVVFRRQMLKLADWLEGEGL